MIVVIRSGYILLGFVTAILGSQTFFFFCKEAILLRAIIKVILQSDGYVCVANLRKWYKKEKNHLNWQYPWYRDAEKSF